MLARTSGNRIPGRKPVSQPLSCTRHTGRPTGLKASLLPLCLICGAAWGQTVELANRVAVQTDEVLVRPNRDWTVRVRAPGAEGDLVVLWLEARLHVPGSKGGGCNLVLRLFIDDQVLVESFSRPRLLNKPPFFDFAGGQYHFSWFSRPRNSWMTLFADTYDVNTVGTGQDTGYLFDLGGLVQPGEEFRLRVQYAIPDLPSMLKQDAPLAVRNVVVGTLSAEHVQELRDAALEGAKERQHHLTIQVDVPEAEAPGEVPYEIAWSCRKESPPAQVAFDRLQSWEAWVLGQADVRVSASRAQRLWHEQVARIRVDKGPSFWLVLHPPRPVLLPASIDAVNCWVYSNHNYGATGAPVDMIVTIADSRGAVLDLSAGQLRGDYWEMRQAVARPEALARLKPPLYFDSLTLLGGQVKKPLVMYLESLAFFKRERKPYTKLGRLPKPGFPTTEDNMLPPSPKGCRISAEATADGKGAVFTSLSPTGTLRYTVPCRRGGFSDVVARFGNGPDFRPLAGGGPQIATPDGPVSAADSDPRLVRTVLQRDRLTARWRFDCGGVTGEYEVSYQLRGRTLIVDVSCPSGVAEGLSLGEVRDLPDAKGIEIPYLVFDRPPSPRVALGAGLFTSVLVDWYHSNCSVLNTTRAASEPINGGLPINGGTTYTPLTNGRRNDLVDRVLVTVSPHIEDTFPTIATPRSERIETLAPSLFVMSSHFTPKYYRTLRRYGLDSVIAMHFAGLWWRRTGEGFAMRWRPRPELSEQDVSQYRADIKSLGYEWGMLVNYTCYFPLNEYWDENLCALDPLGRLADGWYGHYDTKPNAMARLARTVGEKIRERYPTDCVYLDVHTNWGGSAVDYEAGVEGAGTARATILGNAECLREVHNQHRALCSEGIRRWMYAGLADMDYAQWVDVIKPENKLLLPDFDLLRIHPKQIGTAMGYSPTCFFSEEGLKEYSRDPGRGTDHQPFYHYVAATLAHGHSALFGYGYFPSLARTLHYYALLSGPQEDYLPDTVANIAWYSEPQGRFISTSNALRSGVREDGKLRVTYSGGQVAYVNYHAKNTWALSVGERGYLLPPYGWVISKPGRILAYSTLVNGRRVDYVDCPRYVYLNSGNKPATEGAVTVDGAVFITKGKPLAVVPCGDLGSWKSEAGERYPVFQDLVPAGPPPDRGVRLLRVNAAALLGVAEDASVTVDQRDAEGRVVATEKALAGSVALTPDAKTVDYTLE